MDETAELMGPGSDSGTALGTPWDPSNVLEAASSVGCTVMDPFIAIGALEKGESDETSAFNLDSDDSEVRIRRRRHRQMSDPLKRLLKPEIGRLLDFLRWDLPRSAHILSFIKMMIHWKESTVMKRNGLKHTILVSREECGPHFPLTIASYIWKDELRGSIYAPSHFGVQALKEAFRRSKLWPMEAVTAGCEWAIFPAEAANEFLSVKYKEGDLRYTSCPVHLYWMSPGDIQTLEFEIPREFKTNPLNHEHVTTVNRYWGRHRAGSSDLVQQMVVNNPTIGAFTFNDEFAGWALQTHYGALDLVHTVQKHRKKGMARSLLLSLAKALDADGSPAHVFTHQNDLETKTFLAKSGFTFVSEYFYFYVDPPMRPNFNFKEN